MTEKAFKQIIDQQLFGIKLYNTKKNEVLSVSSIVDESVLLSPVYIGHTEAPNTVLDENNFADYEEISVAFDNLSPTQFAAAIFLKLAIDKLGSKFNF